jgi:hypothetical protein
MFIATLPNVRVTLASPETTLHHTFPHFLKPDFSHYTTLFRKKRGQSFRFGTYTLFLLCPSAVFYALESFLTQSRNNGHCRENS